MYSGRTGWCGGVLCGLVLAGALQAPAAAADAIAQARRIAVQGAAAGQASQRRVVALDDETARLVSDYRAVLRNTAELDAYVAQVQPLLQEQAQQLAKLQAQIATQGDVGQQILPLMLQMVNSLAEFVKLDLPFLPVERATRIANLRAALADGALSPAEKFQRVAQAYQVEAEYGRNLGETSETLSVNGQTRAATVLRVGRLVLLYVTPDGGDTGYWDTATRRWVSLGGSYAREIREGVRMARGDLAVAPLRLPLPAAGAGQ